jgi:hypothetical protein
LWYLPDSCGVLVASGKWQLMKFGGSGGNRRVDKGIRCWLLNAANAASQHFKQSPGQHHQKAPVMLLTLNKGRLSAEETWMSVGVAGLDSIDTVLSPQLRGDDDDEDFGESFDDEELEDEDDDFDDEEEVDEEFDDDDEFEEDDFDDDDDDDFDDDDEEEFEGEDDEF